VPVAIILATQEAEIMVQRQPWENRLGEAVLKKPSHKTARSGSRCRPRSNPSSTKKKKKKKNDFM
jgi:hypothetical protein